MRYRVDWLLGDTFLRNVYSLFDLGWDTNPSEGPAYMQLLSVSIHCIIDLCAL